ncbi:beta-lactamase [Marivirga lumbricoides]|uniref:Beta-lactamase n=1 Tax=Marivirga lumbricoides TaxID=1046115 RepID=A0ABQ1LXY0_9BACT|nr:beta-lactamase [Marivirga lumbricoides]
MKIPHITALLLLLFSCGKNENKTDKKNDKVAVAEIVIPEFQSIIDSAAVQGAILIYNKATNTYYSNDFRWANKGHLPASTFKIANSIIALETGIVENDSTLFEWGGEERAMESWEQDLVFREAFHFSCVPCYQEVAREIGVEKMNFYLDTLNYGNMQVDSTNIDTFWLEGASHITQFQQIDFLKRLYQTELPISERTEKIIKKMMVIEANDQFQLSGKTGWSNSNGHNNGWFVGYLESNNNTYFFATNLEPQPQFDMSGFAEIRKELTMQAFKQMDIID